jgi:transposase
MIYYGLDIHKRYTFYTAMDERGRILKQGKVGSTAAGMADIIGPEACVAMESTCNWYHLYDAVEGLAQEVHLAHPLKTRAIAEAKIKTDKVDSTILAHLVRTDLLPTSYVAPRSIREDRELFRYRASLVALQTQVKNKVHGILLKHGYTSPYSDVFGRKGREWLTGLPLEPVYRQALEGYLALLHTLKEQIDDSEKEIKDRVRANPAALLLTSVPGIGYFTALLIISEIGEVGRFPDDRHLASYAGLVPRVHSSGGKTRYGGITKEGSVWLRWSLQEAAQVAIRHSPHFQGCYRRIAWKKGHQRAVTGVARHMVTIVYAMLRSNQPYRENQDTSVGDMAH